MIARAMIVAMVLAMAWVAVAAVPTRASDLNAAERQMLHLVNHARTKHGLRPVRMQATLDLVARSHSRDMVERGYFSHASHDGAGMDVRLRRAGYGLSGYRSCSVSEVIGWGATCLGTPEAVFGAWMRSTLHRQIILGKRWCDVGIGRASGTFHGVSGSVMWTVDVGVRTR
jgi:uncharacterized protein YkwD